MESCHRENQPKARTFHKLDMMKSSQFNRLILFNLFVIAYTFLHVTTVTTLCRTAWYGTKMVKGVRGEALKIETCTPSLPYMKALYLFDLFGRSALIIFAAIFTIRVIGSKIGRSEEQIWAIFMVVATALSYNPTLNIWVLHDHLFNATNRSAWWIFRYSWFIRFLSISRSVNLFLSSFGQLFYVWALSLIHI